MLLHANTNLRTLLFQGCIAIFLMLGMFPGTSWATLPDGCVLTQEEVDTIMNAGFDWYGADGLSANYSPTDVAISYGVITNYLCAGIDPSLIQIGYESGLTANESENFCQASAQYYPSAQGTCFTTCHNGDYPIVGAPRWTTGADCIGTDPADGHWAYVVVSPPQDGGGCYVGSDAISQCNAAQSAYTSTGLLTEHTNQCHDRSYDLSGSTEGSATTRVTQYCFNYTAQQEPDPEDAFSVGDGTTSFDNMLECRTYMIERYPDEAAITHSNPDLCRVVDTPIIDTTGHQIGTSTAYFANDVGLLGLTEQQIQARRDQAAQDAAEQAEQDRLDAIQAEEDRINREADERYAASYKPGQLVPCDGLGTSGNARCDWNALIKLGNNIIEFAIKVAAVVMVIVIFIAGWGLITAQGNTNAMSEARSKLTKAIVGFVVVLTAWLIVDTVMNLLLDESFQTDAVVDLLDS